MSALRRLLGRRGFRRLLIGQTISALGDWMGTIALMVYVLHVTGSTAAVGGVLVLRLLPAAVAGPVAARVSRRWGRRQVMLTMDAARAAFVVLLPLVAALWWVYLWAFLVEVAGLLFLPARDSAIPDLAGEGADLTLADGLMLGSSYGTIPLGAGLFGLVLLVTDSLGLPDHAGFVAVFVVDAVTYLASFAAIKVLSQKALDAAAESREQEEAEFAGFWSALRIPLVQSVTPATLTVALGVGALFSVGIRFMRQVLHASDAEFGVLVALFGVGAAAGLGLAQLFRERELWRVRVGTLGLGLVVAGMSLVANLYLAFLGAVLFGVAATFTLVNGMSILQDRLDGVERDLAFTAFHVMIRGGLAVAALLAGGAADIVHPIGVPVLGTLQPPRLVLLGAGVIVVMGGLLVQERGRLEVARRCASGS